ncbi:PAS domain-containing sensor histidine kinase [Leptolyngbya ohadii]|uniref:PAS domain-containing sensor histidine kinase n=1 Tax=Leptolyngbya ohadii TaxID=1962290 RepID=UPI000B59950C|nr:PAS domain-containing sensor histidine kinase [Leptolyngbya ohadii]
MVLSQNWLAPPHPATLTDLILNAIGEGVYGVDLAGNATFINPAAAQMIGWEIEELLGRSMHEVLHHSHSDRTCYLKTDCPIYAAFKDGTVHRVTDEVFWRKDGTCFPVEYISTPIRDERGQLLGAVVTFQDITQRKWAEAILHQMNEELEQKVRERTVELRQANEQLKDLNEQQSRLVSMVCHEFRNPLNNILLSVSSLDRYSHHLTANEKTEYLQNIQTNVDRMTSIIDDILVIGKVEANRLALNREAIDLVEFCRKLSQEVQAGTQHRINFVCRHSSVIRQFDGKILRLILTNLLSNAIRYSPSCPQVQFKLMYQKQQVTFEIRDWGIGIPAEDQPHLFEPFYRGRNTSNIPGTGLGLSIVKQLVDLQQGKLQVKTRLGAGTTVRVILS